MALKRPKLGTKPAQPRHYRPKPDGKSGFIPVRVLLQTFEWLVRCNLISFKFMSKATHLECSLCGKRHEAGAVANLCDCGGPLLVRYDLDTIRHRWRRREVPNGPANMWRYAPVLPPARESIVSLGEGWTPLIRACRLGARLGAANLWVKD